MKENINKALENASQKYVGLKDLRSLIQLIPFGVGSAIDSFFGNRAETIQSKRISCLLSDIHKTVEKLDERKIDKGYLESDDFYFLCERIFKSSAKERTLSKLQYFRNVFINAITLEEDTGNDFTHRCLDLLENLSFSQIQAFYYVVNEACKSVTKYGTISLTEKLRRLVTEAKLGNKDLNFLKFDNVPWISNLFSQHSAFRLYLADLDKNGLIQMKNYGYSQEKGEIKNVTLTGFGVEFALSIIHDDTILTDSCESAKQGSMKTEQG